MPFAVIAVILLILAGAYGIVTSSIERSQNNMDRMSDEFDSIGSAVSAVKSEMERGIGEIILDMSRESVTGDIEERSSVFGDRMNKWIAFQFPMLASGAVVDILSHDIELGIGTLKAASDDIFFMEGVMPSCYRADGDVTMRVTTSSGSVIKNVNVNADGMSALPLLLENVSMFDIAVTGPRTMITELMTYQLSSLAQYRVMSGYGATSEYGPRGTNAIITDSDVRLAYRIALSVAETTYLRTTSDPEYDMVGNGHVDPGELLAFRDGVVDIDISAVFAQTLLSIADDLVLRWMDYFMFSVILDIIDTIADSLRSAWNWLCKVFTGNEAESASGYISSTMSRNGIPESEYRRLMNGMSCTIDLPSTERETAEIGDGLIEIPEFSVTVAYPDVDVLSWNGWNGFMNRYYAERNQIKDMIMGTLKAIAIGVSGTYRLGVASVECDPYDNIDMMTMMVDAVNEALREQRSAVENRMEETIRSQRIIDPLYVAIYEQMVNDFDSLFGISVFEDRIRMSIRSYVIGHVTKEYGMPLDPYILDSMVDELMLSEGVTDVIGSYRRTAGERLALFEGILNSVETNTNSLFKDLMVLVVRCGMDSLGLYPYVIAKMTGLVREMAEHVSLEYMSGVYELPDAGSFVLTDGKGSFVKEYVSVESDVKLDVKINCPTKGNENTHYVGFFEHREASYSSLFRIDVTADLNYRAMSASSLMVMLETYDAAVTGTSHSEFDIAFAVMSGWPLTGVDYTPSRTILDDAKMVALKLLEPLLGPLYELKLMADMILHAMTTVLMRAAQHVNDLMMKLYEMIMAPLERFGEKINDLLGPIGGIIPIIMITLGSQTFGVDIYGMRLEVITDIAGELAKGTSTTKLKLTIPVRSVTLSATLEIKKDKQSNFSFTGRASATAETWNLDIAVDPLMKVRKSIVEINGTFRGTDIHAVIPQLVQYEELEFRLSDIPGVGDMLSNIPLPIPGTKGSLDAGIELKYDLPYLYGVLINEFELNPPGPDNDNEWVELYNSTVKSVDLTGYRIVPSSNPSKSYEIKDITLGPGGRTVITFPGQFLNNSKEIITLYDADGVEVDCTPMKSDAKNDDFTWQRETDASAKWVLKKGTKGEDNGGKFVNGSPVRAAVMQCVMKAAEDAFKEMGSKIMGPDGVAQFLKRMVELTIQYAIDMIANCVVSASIFIELAISDLSGSGHGGIRFSLMLDKEIIKDGLTWAVGQIVGMMNNIDNPTGMTPRQIISDDIYFQTMVYAQVTAPKILRSGIDTKVTAGVVVGCNMTALCNLFGRSGGTWKVNIGLVLEDIPTAMIPPMLKADPDKKSDLWLFRMTLEKAKG